jgi:GNAT superfamily N-acetyltransferase
LEPRIRRLEANDDPTRFDCGVEPMNDWLRTVAGQHQQKNLSRTFVATLPAEQDQIVGFYALAATSVEANGMPGSQRLPRNVSAVLLARLAVDRRHKGQGLGEYLLMHALDTVLSTAENIGIQCVVVDAIDSNAAGFYAKYGFAAFTDRPLRLVLPVATIRQTDLP